MHQATESFNIFSTTVDDLFLNLLQTLTSRDKIDEIAKSLSTMLEIVDILVKEKAREDQKGDLALIFIELGGSIKWYSTEHRRKYAVTHMGKEVEIEGIKVEINSMVEKQKKLSVTAIGNMLSEIVIGDIYERHVTGPCYPSLGLNILPTAL